MQALGGCLDKSRMTHDAMYFAQIHWRSVQGSSSMGSAIDIANRGQIRFYRKSPSSCAVKLTISYELPDVLVPFGNVRLWFFLINY